MNIKQDGRQYPSYHIPILLLSIFLRVGAIKVFTIFFLINFVHSKKKSCLKCKCLTKRKTNMEYERYPYDADDDSDFDDEFEEYCRQPPMCNDSQPLSYLSAVTGRKKKAKYCVGRTPRQFYGSQQSKIAQIHKPISVTVL